MNRQSELAVDQFLRDIGDELELFKERVLIASHLTVSDIVGNTSPSDFQAVIDALTQELIARNQPED